MNGNKSNMVIKNSKGTKVANCKINNLFDGIQVSINSDEEELDYFDDVPNNEDDEGGSMDKDAQADERVVEPRETDHDHSRKSTEKSPAPAAESVEMVFGATSASLNEEELVMNNPHLRKLLNKMLDERIQDAKNRGETSESEILSKMTPQANKRKNPGIPTVKSPSDTTIYVPALNKIRNSQQTTALANKQTMVDISQEFGRLDQIGVHANGECDNMNRTARQTENQKGIGDNMGKEQHISTDLMNKISNFVEQIRIEQQEEGNNTSPEPARMRSAVSAPGFDEAQKRMDNAIVETEKFRASLEKPPGMEMSLPFANLPEMRTDNSGSETRTPSVTTHNDRRQVVGCGGISDDDFFHQTCHIDLALRNKIERGKYVDLDKLLPKDNNFFSGRLTYSNETKLEWVQSEGSTYLVPAKIVVE